MLHNRDMSWLGFNLRVLQEAADPTVALYERLKFLSVFSSNLDEFFRVRYPAVIALSGLNKKTREKAGIETTVDIAVNIQREVNRQLVLFGRILEQEIIPELKRNGIVLYYNMPVRQEHTREIKELFFADVLSFIETIILTANHKTSFLPKNNRLYFVVTLKEAQPGALKQAMVSIPSGKINRFFTLSPLDGMEYVIFLDDIIRNNMGYLFPSLEILDVFSIKCNRNAALNLEEEYSGNLLMKIEKQLKKRDTGAPSRFLYEPGMPRNLRLFLTTAFMVKMEDLFEGGRYHHLSDLSFFPAFGKKLHYPLFRPLVPAHTSDSGNIFQVMERQDVLLHLPYQSYNPVLSFFNQAAADETVTEIAVTLYRLAPESHIAHALISAAKNGKHVVVFIELKARFDEARNIKWSRTMKAAGIRLVYSLPQIKVHVKVALVKKMVNGRQRMYALVSTGNFNELTARFYTDHVLMTSGGKVIKDLLLLFKYLEKGRNEFGEHRIKFSELLVAPFNLADELERCAEKEIKKSLKGAPARIRIKVNNLEDPGIISLLYKAGMAGVQIHLMVRSVCCIVSGISEHITIRRIVDRFLEHTRLFIFGADDDALVFMGSADLMTRNLHHRVEVCVPINDAACKKELLDYFNIQWSDNHKAVQQLADSQYTPVKQVNGHGINAQESIYEYLKSHV